MTTAMDRLDKWLNANLQEVGDDLAPGCSEAEIAEFERLVGRAFPEGLKVLYRWHDGQRGDADTGPFFGLDFLSLAGAKAHWESWKKAVDDASPDDMKNLSEFCTSATPGAVKAVYANAYWIPFAYDHGGNHLGVDLDPGENGTVGQVINFGRDEENKFVLASSMTAFLEWLVEQLESGNAVIAEEDDGGRSLNIREPESSHFLDALEPLFA